MKYLLGVGFVVTKKYKKSPIARVYIDNKFLDEVTIDNYPNRKGKWERDTKIWIYNRDYANYKHKGPRWSKKLNKLLPTYYIFDDTEDNFPLRWKFYIIDEDVLKNSKEVKVEVKNSDSNYTNGFMTKTTLMNLFSFLIPIKYLKFFCKDGDKFKQEFIQAVVDKRYGYTNFAQNRAHVTNTNRHEIGLQLTSRLITYNEKFMRRSEGYPFTTKIFWNKKQEGEATEFGGDGCFSMQLKTKDTGVITYDTYDDETIKLLQKGKIDQDCGFHISEKFFSMAHRHVFDKYLHYEN